MDRMRLRSNSRDPDLRVSEFGVITSAIGEHHLVRLCVKNHRRPRNFHFITRRSTDCRPVVIRWIELRWLIDHDDR